MRLRTQILLPLLLTTAVLGAAAVGAVVQVGEAKALAEARSDLAARSTRLAQEVEASVEARADGIAMLAFAAAETGFATQARGASPEQAAAAKAQLASFYREASLDLFDRVARLDAAGREQEAFAQGAAAAPDPARGHGAEAAFARVLADPTRPALDVAAGRLVAMAAILDPSGAFAGVARGEKDLASIAPPPRVPGLAAASAVLLDARGAPLVGAAAPALPPALLEPSPDGGEARSTSRDGMLFAAAPVAGPAAETWWVALAMPAAAATAAVVQPIYLLGAALLGLALIATAIVALVLRRSLRPLERLSRAVRGLGSGPPGGHVAPEGAGELKALAGSFNAMVDRLQEREASLERELESRAQTAKFATIGSLSAGVAHEIKNPLTGMKMQTEMLQRLAAAELGGSDEQARKRLAEAATRMAEVNQRGIERIEKVVASLSMLARPRPALEEVDLAAVAEASVALAGANLRGKAEVHLDIPQGLRAVASTDGLGQVLLNLVGNAADAMPQEGGWIRIAAARVGKRVHLTVEDNGPGIAPEVAARLGEPFFTTKPSGTGLGLSISRRILHDLGGELRFENRAEGGTRFTVDLVAGPLTAAKGAP